MKKEIRKNKQKLPVGSVNWEINSLNPKDAERFKRINSSIYSTDEFLAIAWYKPISNYPRCNDF